MVPICRITSITVRPLPPPGADVAIGVGQYWANVTDGYVHIPRVRAGTYRLTVYAEGVFGQLEMDDIVVQAGDGAGEPFAVEWKCESHGTFRLAF